MDVMQLETFEPTAAALDREIESLVGKQVRGELSKAEALLLARLVARRTRNMRPARGQTVRYFAKLHPSRV